MLSIWSLEGLPEIVPGDDLPDLILAAAARGPALQSGDILIVTHKIVSKAEGNLVALHTIEPSPTASAFAAAWGKDARQVELVLRQARRVVRMERGVIITETRHGFVCANAGIDISNVPGHDVACLLPDDPDASATRLHQALSTRLGFPLPVVISDSFGRPWRTGIVNVAIGVAGLEPLVDYRGITDPHGHLLVASLLATADELAAAAELVMGKVDGRPVVVVRGFAYTPGDGSGRQLIMDPTRDLFR